MLRSSLPVSCSQRLVQFGTQRNKNGCIRGYFTELMKGWHTEQQHEPIVQNAKRTFQQRSLGVIPQPCWRDSVSHLFPFTWQCTNPFCCHATTFPAFFFPLEKCASKCVSPRRFLVTRQSKKQDEESGTLKQNSDKQKHVACDEKAARGGSA